MVANKRATNVSAKVEEYYSSPATLEWIEHRWGGFNYLVLARNENFQLWYANDQLTLHAESDDINSPAWEIMLFDKPTKSQVADTERIFGVEIDPS